MKIIILLMCLDLLAFGIGELHSSIVSGVITITLAVMAGVMFLTNKNIKWWHSP